jgi:NAD(P)-dependent dehydrogenase (short-subunit alcohol dehydrogenase family)
VKSSPSSVIDSIIEATVVPSFTSIGPGARRRLFGWESLESYDLTGQTVVITGGTSGIGEESAGILARIGADLVIVGRDQVKTEATVDRIKAETGNTSVSYVLADLGSQDDVRRAAAELADRHDTIHTLIHNAGALFNERRRAENGTDLAVELMVAAPFLLTGLLLPQLRSADPGRVLTMSSGGMYTQALTVSQLDMHDDEHNGAIQYARAKRTQVVLNEMWAQRIGAEEIVFHSMHPGWVDTPGVSDALPGFSKVLGPLHLLRSPREGADTLVWLAADDRALETSGDFWHDRQVRSTHKLPTTKASDTPERRKRLWEWCEAHTGWSLN